MYTYSVSVKVFSNLIVLFSYRSGIVTKNIESQTIYLRLKMKLLGFQFAKIFLKRIKFKYITWSCDWRAACKAALTLACSCSKDEDSSCTTDCASLTSSCNWSTTTFFPVRASSAAFAACTAFSASCVFTCVLQYVCIHVLISILINNETTTEANSRYFSIGSRCRSNVHLGNVTDYV